MTEQVGLDMNNARFSFMGSWDDYDNDGDQDLYVANDYGRDNLYRNDDGHFLDVAEQAGAEDAASGMSVSWGITIEMDGWMYTSVTCGPQLVSGSAASLNSRRMPLPM